MGVMYMCPCGRAHGQREQIPDDPTVIVSWVPDTYSFELLRRETKRDFSCPYCKAPYDATGAWVDADTVPNIEPPVFMGNLKPEIPEHFNRSLGQVVHSREHLEHLQEQYGCQDRSPGHTSSDGYPDVVPRDFHEVAVREQEKAEAIAKEVFVDSTDPRLTDEDRALDTVPASMQTEAEDWT